jgi:hypothetical protein
VPPGQSTESHAKRHPGWLTELPPFSYLYRYIQKSTIGENPRPGWVNRKPRRAEARGGFSDAARLGQLAANAEAEDGQPCQHHGVGRGLGTREHAFVPEIEGVDENISA